MKSKKYDIIYMKDGQFGRKPQYTLANAELYVSLLLKEGATQIHVAVIEVKNLKIADL